MIEWMELLTILKAHKATLAVIGLILIIDQVMVVDIIDQADGKMKMIMPYQKV